MIWEGGLPRFSNRLTAKLKIYFPQVLEWFAVVSSALVGDFLERWPTLEKLQKARPETLRNFFRQHHLGNSVVDDRLERIRQAVPSTQDMAVIRWCCAEVIALVGILSEIRSAIASYDEQIETFARQHPDFGIMESLCLYRLRRRLLRSPLDSEYRAGSW